MTDRKALDRRRSPFIGRDKEQDIIFGQLKAVSKGEGGRVLAITGEAGIGKSRLVQNIIDKHEGKGPSVLVGKCLFQETAMPYLPFIDIMSTYLSKKGSEPKDRARYNIPVGLTGLDDDPEKFQRDIKDLVRGAPSILSKLSDKEFKDEREWMFSIISQSIRDLARDGPVVLFIDDIHFADKASLQLFDHLVHRMKGERFLFVVAYRPEELATSSTGALLRDLLRRLSSERLLTELVLKPLTKPDTKSIALDILDVRELPEKFIAALHRETGGNPYFLEEVLGHLIDEGKAMVGDQDALKGLDPKVVHVPETLSDLVLRKVDNLGPEHKKVLQAASVIGDPFSLGLLGEVVGLDEGALVDIVEKLMLASLVSEDKKGDGDLFHFNQALIRSVIYSNLSMGRKRLLHRQTGHSLEKRTMSRAPQTVYSLANHFAIGHVPEKAVQYNTLAGDKASASYAADEAVLFYIQALDFLDHLSGGEDIENRRTVLLLKIGDLYRLQGKWEKGLEYYTQMIAIAKAVDDDGMVGLALRKMGHLEQYRGNWDDAERLLREGLRIAKEEQDEIGIADAERGLGCVCWRKGEYDEAVRHITEGLIISEKVNDHYILGYSYTELGNIYNDKGDFDKADLNYKKAVEYFEPLDEHLALARVYNNIGVVWARRGEWAKSLEQVQRSVGIYERSGSPHFIGMPLCNLSVCYSKAGRLKEAKHVLERLELMLESSESPIVNAAFQLEYGIMYRFSKDWKHAEERICRSIDMFKALNVPNMEAVALEELGKMFAAKGDLARARQSLQRARDIHVKTSSTVNIKTVDDLLWKLDNGEVLPL